MRCLEKLVAWTKQKTDKLLQLHSVIILCSFGYPEEHVMGIRKFIQQSNILSEILELAAEGELILSKPVQKREVQVGELIAQGAGVKVYNCIYRGQEIVIKKLGEKGAFYSSLRSVRTEIALMCLFDHPNIIRCIGANLTDDEPFLLMPKCSFSSFPFILLPSTVYPLLFPRSSPLFPFPSPLSFPSLSPILPTPLPLLPPPFPLPLPVTFLVLLPFLTRQELSSDSITPPQTIGCLTPFPSWSSSRVAERDESTNSYFNSTSWYSFPILSQWNFNVYLLK